MFLELATYIDSSFVKNLHIFDLYLSNGV